MRSFRREILLKALKVFHVAIMIIAFVLATVPVLAQSHAVSLTAFLSIRVKIGNFFIFLSLLSLWHILFATFGLYDSRRLSTLATDSRNILMATSLGTLCVYVMAMILHIQMVTPTFLVLFWALSSLMLVCSRLMLRLLLARVRLRGRNLRDMLIIGTNSRAIQFARKIQAKPELGYRIMGFADCQWAGSEEFRRSGYSLGCDLDSLAAFFRKNVVDEVAMALPMRSFHQEASRIAAVCEEQGIIFRVLYNLFDLKLGQARVEEVEGDSWITHYAGIYEGWPLVMKRVLDFLIALMALVVLSPIILVAAILIKLTSPGPILFKQQRIGQNKRQFNIYKFRSMVIDAEKKMQNIEHLNEASGPVFKIKHDPRITPVGSVLRKMSIDELPQFVNVLKGDMSLVGPRPLPIRDYEGFSEDWHRRRFSVRPGITCLWQVNGRSSLTFDKWMELDMQYVDKWSLWLDLKILAKTVPVVLRGTGAA
jgi:exopolysaccharide biosynthesis polyprenyl glycosylphosphotransferase